MEYLLEQMLAVSAVVGMASYIIYKFHVKNVEELLLAQKCTYATGPMTLYFYDTFEIHKVIAKYMMSSDCIEMREMAARICRDYLNGTWRTITARDIVLKRISGGLSNWLYHVSLPETQPPESTEPSQVLLRLYGQTHGTERALEGLVTESVIFTLLSERKLGPKLHGIFPGGRIEEYIPARPLKTRELWDVEFSKLIAEKMAGIHRMNIPINKEPYWVWNTISGWLQNVQANLEDPSIAETGNAEIINTLKSYDLGEEVTWLKNYISNIHSPVVFCHNDMQEGNILLYCDHMTEEEAMSKPELVLIDFEYCSYNYRGFDIANHFIEWMYDYTYSAHPYYRVHKNTYPSLEQQLVFLKDYLRTGERELTPSQEKEELKSLIREIEAFSLVSHLFWGLWSAVNAKLSQIPFGYWEYAIERLGSYFQMKKKVMEKIAMASILCEMGVQRRINDVES